MRGESLPRVARYFNVVVAGVVFGGMLLFAGGVVALALSRQSEGRTLVRVLAGALIGGAALTFLAALRSEARSGEPFQHSRKVPLAVALLGMGTTILGLALR